MASCLATEVIIKKACGLDESDAPLCSEVSRRWQTFSLSMVKNLESLPIPS
jgi:hypothetical protein